MLGSVFKKNDTFGACSVNPRNLGPPIADTRNKASKRVLAPIVGGEDFDLVPFLLEAKVQRRKIAKVADAEEAHAPM